MNEETNLPGESQPNNQQAKGQQSEETLTIEEIKGIRQDIIEAIENGQA